MTSQLFLNLPILQVQQLVISFFFSATDFNNSFNIGKTKELIFEKSGVHNNNHAENLEDGKTSEDIRMNNEIGLDDFFSTHEIITPINPPPVIPSPPTSPKNSPFIQPQTPNNTPTNIGPLLTPSTPCTSPATPKSGRPKKLRWK